MAAEARQTAAWLAARGITSRILAWEGPKPAAGIQAAARAARYALLEAACREAGLLHLLLAHHALDLAETTLIRAERGSGATGLAGMAAVRERPGLRLLRPLLGVMPDRLRATLRELGQPWLEDPSNRSPASAAAGCGREADIDPGRWLAVAREAASARRGGGPGSRGVRGRGGVARPARLPDRGARPLDAPCRPRPASWRSHAASRRSRAVPTRPRRTPWRAWRGGWRRRPGQSHVGRYAWCCREAATSS